MRYAICDSFNLFLFWYLFQGSPKNVPKAIELYEAAVKDELPDAQFHLGVMLDQGRDVRLNIVIQFASFHFPRVSLRLVLFRHL